MIVALPTELPRPHTPRNLHTYIPDNSANSISHYPVIGNPIPTITDCKSLFDAVKTTNTLEDKGLRIPMACLRQRFNRNEVRYVWVPTNLQLADCLTKAGASSSLLREVLKKGKLPSELSQYSEL